MDDTYAIRLAKTELREGYNTGDVERILSAYGDGFSDLSTGRAPFYGKEARAVLRHRLAKMFEKYRAHLAVTVVTVTMEGSLAFDWGWHKLTLTPRRGGRPRTTTTRYLEIWRKQARGQWKIAIFFDNLDEPVAMPPREVLRAMMGARAGSGRRRQ